MGAPFDKIAKFETYGDFVSQLFFIYKVHSDDTVAAPATHGNLIIGLHAAALVLDGAIAVTDFLAAKKAETEEEVPEETTDEPTDETTDPATEETTDGYYWARWNYLNKY